MMPLLTVVCPLICGIPMMLFMTRVKKFGMVTIMGVIIGVFLWITGMGYWPAIFGLVFGLLTDLIDKSGNYKSAAKTVIGESGGTFSGGERQRLSIARAMMKDAPIIILDEATANVDPENERKLMEAIGELTREKTILMIAHRLKNVQGADQILVVDQGRIVQQGTQETLMKQEGIYRRFIEGREQAVSWKL